MTFTGRKRYRRGWFGKLILQIEETFDRWDSLGGDIDCRRVKRWRDATVDDISLEEAA